MEDRHALGSLKNIFYSDRDILDFNECNTEDDEKRNFSLVSFNSSVLRREQKITLVLDLDETLIHSSIKSSGNDDYVVEVSLKGVDALYFVKKRPHLDYFIDVVSNWFTLTIFTTSVQTYADPIVSWIDRGRGVISKRFFRNDCIKTPEEALLKNLNLVSDDFSRLVLIDNCSVSIGRFPNNSIPVTSWFSDKSDTCLVDILPFLDALRFCADVRSILCLRRNKVI